VASSKTLSSVIASVNYLEEYISCKGLAEQISREHWQLAYEAVSHLSEVEAELREAVKLLREREGVV